MRVKISTTNSKLGLIPSVNLPPIESCRKDCPCSGDCYALKGRYRFKNVKETHKRNLQAYLDDPKQYFDDIYRAINNGIIVYSYFRWHASGDIVDKNYLIGMFDLARRLPTTSFLAFTKKFELVNEYVATNDIPANLNIVFSAWDKDFKLDNPHNFPVAYIKFPDEERNTAIPLDAIECSGDCTHCLRCWDICRGQSVVFHKH